MTYLIWLRYKKKRRTVRDFLIGPNLMNLFPVVLSESVIDTHVYRISFVLLFCCLLGPDTLAKGDSLPLGTYLYHYCEGVLVGNVTDRSEYTYQMNIISLLFTHFLDNEIDSLFYKTTHGEYPEVHGLYSCRADMSVADCKTCVYMASQDVFVRRCKNGINGMIWAEGCFVRYANASFTSGLVSQPERVIWSQRNTSVTEDSDLEVKNMFQNLRKMAVSYFSGLNYASTEIPFLKVRLTGFVQCIQDISRSDCDTCLQKAIEFMFSSIYAKDTKEAGRYLCPSCIMTYRFSPISISGLERVTPLEGSKEVEKTSEEKSHIVVHITISVALLFVLSALYIVYSRWNQQIKKDDKNSRQKTETKLSKRLQTESFSRAEQKSAELPLMSFSDISVATKQFSHENKIGEGGFGPVYKGMLLNGEEVAVKRCGRASGQGLQEYENEVSLIANLQHRNLVKLLGCCLEANELLLIYEYMPNKSLDIFLSDPEKNKNLDWGIRFSIINGIAKGMLYLHEDSRLRIIHRDLKASNVLLDHEMNPKISDFGMARVFCSNQNAANTNRVMGTYGYMAPEYAMEGLFSVKSDVYSYGVLLLEIISGKKNTGFHLIGESHSLVTRAWALWAESETLGLDLLDPSLKNSNTYDPFEVIKCIHIALLCIQDDPADRPTMSSVVFMLGSENTTTFHQPSQPTFTIDRYNRRMFESTPTDSSTSNNDVTISAVVPR